MKLFQIPLKMTIGIAAILVAAAACSDSAKPLADASSAGDAKGDAVALADGASQSDGTAADALADVAVPPADVTAAADVVEPAADVSAVGDAVQVPADVSGS